MLIAIAIYVLGSILGYLLFRRDMRRQFNEWTISDRNMAFMLSLLSWITVFVGVIFYLGEGNNKPAKW